MCYTNFAMPELVHDLNSIPEPSTKKLPFFLSIFALVFSGVLFGFLLTKIPGKSSTKNVESTPIMIKTANEVGSTDTKTFRDTATGTIETGGLNGEGTHKLLREGGASQTVYLFSSVIDLEEFSGKKVQLWGETVRGQKAAWLMDVGRVKLVEN